MRSVRIGLLPLLALLPPLPLLVPGLLAAQGAATHAAPPAYRGLAPGLSYRAFVERANALADHDVLVCNTSQRTAYLMECGVGIRDPGDGARFYLSGHFIEQRASVIALYDSAGFHDTRGPELVARTQRDLTRVFGRHRQRHPGAWEWNFGHQFVRLTWRARGTGRWVDITLIDKDVLDRIGSYEKARGRGKT